MKNQKTSIKGIMGTIIILGLIAFGVYSFMQPEEKKTTEVVAEPQEVKSEPIEPFYTINLRQDDFHTPENSLLDFMTAWHKEEWSKMSKASNNWSAQKLHDHFYTYKLGGYRLLDSNKTGSRMFEYNMEYTYTNALDEVKTKRVTALLFMDDDGNWFMNPLTAL